MKETVLMATDCPMERLEDLLHSLLAPTHGLDENAGGKIHTPGAPLLCLAGEGRRWLAPEVSPSLLLPGRALLTADESKSPPGKWDSWIGGVKEWRRDRNCSIET